MKVNSVIKIFLKTYKSKIKNVRKNSIQLQKKTLLNVLKSTYSDYKSVTDFLDTPPTTYSQYKPTIQERIENNDARNKWKRIKYFAKSAGTTSAHKYIPTSNQYLWKNHKQASWLTLSLLYEFVPDIDMFSNKNLLLGGAIYTQNKSTIVGDISALMMNHIPKHLQKYHLPSIKKSTHPNWQDKFEEIIRQGQKTDQVVLVGGVPTWVLASIKRIVKEQNKPLTDIWPNLKAYLHGGVNIDQYMPTFRELMPAKLYYHEVYNASEGFIATQDKRISDGLLLMTDHGIFFEFIPFDDYKKGSYDIIDLSKAEINIDYVLLISNISGLSRYVLGDIVKFISLHPYRIQITGRLKEYINAFGEDLSIDQVTTALKTVNEIHKAHINEFTVAPRYPSITESGLHQWFIEFDKKPKNLSEFALDLDRELQNINFNYRQKRTDNLGMDPLQIILLPVDTFQDLSKKHEKFGGQNKIQKMRNDRKLADQIFNFLKK